VSVEEGRDMAGVWKKTLQYLGLVEDEDLEVGDDEPGATIEHAPAPARRHRADVGTLERTETVVRAIPQRPASLAAIHRAEPKRFDEAREIGERYRRGVPVIMNLQGTEDAVARRLVDFASGLVFGLDGKIEPVAQRVYLLTPANMEVSAEDRERLVEGRFFNQF
jgi:cell division inhibitor SepF